MCYIWIWCFAGPSQNLGRLRRVQQTFWIPDQPLLWVRLTASVMSQSASARLPICMWRLRQRQPRGFLSASRVTRAFLVLLDSDRDQRACSGIDCSGGRHVGSGAAGCGGWIPAEWTVRLKYTRRVCVCSEFPSAQEHIQFTHSKPEWECWIFKIYWIFLKLMPAPKYIIIKANFAWSFSSCFAYSWTACSCDMYVIRLITPYMSNASTEP